MGWWKPYFFDSPIGVQLLFPTWVITGVPSFLVATIAIALLCLSDRLSASAASTFRKHADVNRDADSARCGADMWAVFLWTLQRLTSGLIMLIMMSFNLLLFLETVIFLGLSELAVTRWRRKTDSVQFTRVPGDDEGSKDIELV